MTMVNGRNSLRQRQARDPSRRKLARPADVGTIPDFASSFEHGVIAGPAPMPTGRPRSTPNTRKAAGPGRAVDLAQPFPAAAYW